MTRKRRPATPPGVPPAPWGDGPAPTCIRAHCTRLQHPWGKGYCTDHAYAVGAFEQRVDPSPVQEHLEILPGTPTAIARAAGVSEATIVGIQRGHYRQVAAKTARRILAVRPEDVKSNRRPTWPLVRRIRALRAVGWTNREVAEQCGGLSTETVSRMIRGEIRYVHSGTDEKIRRGYEEAPKQMRRKPHWQVARGRWVAPYMWEDIDWPDDPAAGNRADEKPLVDVEIAG